MNRGKQSAKTDWTDCNQTRASKARQRLTCNPCSLCLGRGGVGWGGRGGGGEETSCGLTAWTDSLSQRQGLGCPFQRVQLEWRVPRGKPLVPRLFSITSILADTTLSLELGHSTWTEWARKPADGGGVCVEDFQRPPIGRISLRRMQLGMPLRVLDLISGLNYYPALKVVEGLCRWRPPQIKILSHSSEFSNSLFEPLWFCLFSATDLEI